MKRTSLSVVWGAAFCLSLVGLAAPASAVTLAIGDANQLGYIDPGAPASEAEEAGYINFMTDLASGGSGFVDPGGPQENEIFRTMNVLCGFSGACPEADDATASKSGEDPSGTGIDLGTGYTYLLAKYDGPNFGSVVWYVAGLTGTVDIPQEGGGYGLSHYTLFNPTPGDDDGGDDNVDGGDDDEVAAEPTTLLLLGSGLVAASARLRRRRNS